MSANLQCAALLLAVSLLAGCGKESVPPPTGNSQLTGSYFEDYRKIQFKDDVQSNVAADGSIGDLTFTGINGNEASLKDYLGKKHVVLIVTRGFNGSICLYCATQTSRLLTNYAKFSQRDAEVIVVFPVMTPDDSIRHRDFAVSVKNKLDTPVEKIPFPIVLDVELKAVNQLGIRKDLSKPATYILDKEGQTRFAYVGDSLADRPSVKALLDQLDALNKDASGG